MTTEATHPFERAGLGAAPFRFLGIEEQDMRHGRVVVGRGTASEVETQAGGTCAFCGNFILVMCRVESADGRRFHVGSDCVEKVDDTALRATVKRAVAKRRNAQRREREAARIAAAKAMLPQVRDAIAAEPHPLAWRAEKGDTLADWCDWMLANAGKSGSIRAAKVIEKHAA